MKLHLPCLLAAALVLPCFSADESDATPADARVSLEIRLKAEQSKDDPVELLEMIDREVSAHPEHACEIVKAAILGTGCDEAIVGYVVETAVRAAPDQMRLISQCAIATAPDALRHVQEVMARLDPSAGEKALSAKSAKDAKGGPVVRPAATPPDPLDIPVVAVPPLPPIITPPVGTETELRTRR